jgi:hypothetical protein
MSRMGLSKQPVQVLNKQQEREQCTWELSKSWGLHSWVLNKRQELSMPQGRCKWARRRGLQGPHKWERRRVQALRWASASALALGQGTPGRTSCHSRKRQRGHMENTRGGNVSRSTCWLSQVGR